MKSLILILISSMLLLFSCQKDDDDKNSTPNGNNCIGTNLSDDLAIAFIENDTLLIANGDDGSNKEQLRSFKSLPPNSEISYSRSTNKFVFNQRKNESTPIAEIYISPISGCTPVQLTNNYLQETVSSLSPDGSTVAYFQYTENALGSLRLINSSGANDRRLTFDPPLSNLYAISLSWAPDGSHLYMSGDIKYQDQRELTGLFKINVNNGSSRYIPFWNNHGINPKTIRVSPDGSTILFNRNDFPQTIHTNLYKIDNDGYNLVKLTDLDHNYYSPIEVNGFSWSPNGSKIIFSANLVDTQKVANFSSTDILYDLYTIDADGNNLERLTNDTIQQTNPFWL